MNDDLLNKFNEVEKFHWWWAGRQELVKDLLLPEGPQKILDIGCGTGETLTFMKKIFSKSKLQGIDYLPEAVKYTRGRGHSALRADALHLPFAAAAFDAVLLLDVIEHIKNDSGVIKEAKRVLKPGGVIILTAPALSFIWSAHDVGQGHERRYTRHLLLRLAAKNKMAVPFISYFNFLLSPVIIMIRLASRLPFLSRLGQYDSKLNYHLAYNKTVNSLLRFVFISEIKMLKLIRYPIGISIAVKMQKT